MSVTVCLHPQGTLGYPEGGGYLWIYLNWALGLRALGCEVIWLEAVPPSAAAEKVRVDVERLAERLRPYGLDGSLALCSTTGEPLPSDVVGDRVDLDGAAEADLLLNQHYGAPPEVVGRFRRSALLDIDPGLLQIWMSKGWLRVARHDAYFTIGEAVGRPGSRIPDVGVEWRHTPPCVALEWWPVCEAGDDAALTTLTHWYAGGGADDTEEAYADDKRSGFLPYLDLPRSSPLPLELALDVASDENEASALRARGWRVKNSYEVAPTPWDFQRYVQTSLGEFSCAKPSYVRLETGWLSDRTVCYLASGKPCVVQHTGPSRYLPDAAGIFRFRDAAEAARHLEAAASDYMRQCALARALAEELFDARKAARGVLEGAGL